MTNKVGFMQGRLSPLVDGKIQCFPIETWKTEFKLAAENGYSIIEWTLDHQGLYDNPFMSDTGRQEIERISKKYKVKIPSVTCDCCMQAPFWKAENEPERTALENEFLDVCKSAAKLQIKYLVVPLVDNGSCENSQHEDALIVFMLSNYELLQALGVKVAFETDYSPNEVARFIRRLPESCFGVNYDIGNSAALGYDVQNEMNLYGQRIFNVHVKDRKFKGTTVPLGAGDANFDLVFQILAGLKYDGNYILQTARSKTCEHVSTLNLYRSMTEFWIDRSKSDYSSSIKTS